MTKTDDYTFASTEGALLQTYWNGRRRVEFTDVPFATARDATSAGGAVHDFRRGTAHPLLLTSDRIGMAQLDFAGSGFGVKYDEFRAMGW